MVRVIADVRLYSTPLPAQMDALLERRNIGIFGAGHLGRAVALRLLHAGVARSNLAICHSGAAETRRQLESAGLSGLLADPEEVVARAQILLYLVRPQHYKAIAQHRPAPGLLFVSFLAGVSLNTIPVLVPLAQRMRVMTSAPDTLLHGKAIAAIYPAGNAHVRAILQLLGAQILPLSEESQAHAFTVLGPCLPIALTFWESMGRTTDERELVDVAVRSGLPEYSGLLKWAREIQPRGLAGAELEAFVAQATTPGGVTEAILVAMREGNSLAGALWRGIQRSHELNAVRS